MDKQMQNFFNKRADSYDEVHISHIDGGIKTKEMVSNFVPQNSKKVLDLGAGTGLELKHVFQKFPSIEVDWVDFAENMLRKLKDKYKNYNVNIINQDFFDFHYKKSFYDCVISVMALHHFAYEQKLKLYKYIHKTLKPDGAFIISDYIVDSIEEEKEKFEEYEKSLEIKNENNEDVHIDIPLSLKTETEILKKCNFKNIKVRMNLKNTKLITCIK
jgi:tRNA (cmo5U34)-methyltransferase